MATAAPVQNQAKSDHQAELDRLAADFFQLAESQLEAMPAEKRKTVIASIHATAENLRATK